MSFEEEMFGRTQVPEIPEHCSTDVVHCSRLPTDVHWALMRKVLPWVMDPPRQGIQRTFMCATHAKMFRMLRLVTEAAERENHFPSHQARLQKDGTWHITFFLTTPSAEFVTLNDFTMAKIIDAVASLQ